MLDSEVSQDTLWYDEILNSMITSQDQNDESPQLATPLPQGAKTETKTSGTPTGKSTTEPL